jgi:flagellar protein FlaG
MVIDLINRLAVNPIKQLVAPEQASNGTHTGEGPRQTPAASGNALPPKEGAGAPADPDRTAQAVVDLNDYVQQVGREIRFSVHEGSGRTVIKVMNSETQELIRQIPSDELLALAEFLEDAQEISSTGLSEKA